MKSLAGSGGRLVALAATATLALALSVAYQWPGVVLSPDGWAYWESSLSLLRGDGYCYFGGQPVTLWPPLFPLYLAAWQAFAGSLAGALALAQAAALGLAAALWGQLALPEKGLDAPALLALPALAELLAIFQRELASESLFIALAGAALLVALPSGRPRGAGRWVALAVVVAALLLTRNAALALVPGLAVIAARPATAGHRPAWIPAAGAALGGVALWVLARALLGQSGSHPPVLPEVSRFASVAQGLGERWVAEAGPARWRIGALLATGQVVLGLAAVGWRDGGAELARARRIAGFAALTLAVTVLLLPVASPLEDRFGRFLLPALPALVLVPASLARASGPRARRALAWLLLAGTAAVATRRATYWSAYATRDPAGEGIAWSSCLDPRGAAVGCVAPPDQPWIDRHAGDAAGAGR